MHVKQRVYHTKDLEKVYHTGENVQVHALNGVNLELYDGELIVLLGPSGSGKSTLLNILGGLDQPTKGTFSYRDRDMTQASSRELTLFRRDAVGFIFQFHNLIPSLTALENVRLITDIAEDPMNPKEALNMVQLGDRCDHFPSQLSGGQQQRIAIARAIAKRPQVLLCDEPTGALDVKTGIVVLEAINQINQQFGTLAVIITHNAVIAEMADRVIHFSDGKVTGIQENAQRRPISELSW